MVAVASVNVDEGFEVLPSQAAEEPQSNPFAALRRALRGRWKTGAAAMAVAAPLLASAGYLSGVQLYEAQAILRVFPQETNILYATGEASVLKTFDSFVKAETTYVASHHVMARSAKSLSEVRPDLVDGLKASKLSKSIEVRRSDSLIVLKTRSKDAAFAVQKLEAVIASYLQMKSEAEEIRSSVRLEELYAREGELVSRLDALRSDQLEVGGEFGLNALAKAHIEKIAQIDNLSSRKAEVAATLATLQADDVSSSADTSNEEIMRATLLDRAMADLNFERAKLMSNLAGLKSGYVNQMNPRYERKLSSKRDEIAVIETAMADRREQIRVLGQTGALTDVTESGDDTTAAEIKSLYDKVSRQLEIARKEARDLNRRRIDLDRIENEIEAAERLLEETRRALEVIRLESGRALPGYAVVMSPPSLPTEPAEDTRKMLTAVGLTGGVVAGMGLMLGLGLREKRVRFAESLTSIKSRLPVQQVTDMDEADSHSADLLRNELQMQALRKPRLVGVAPVIAVTSVSRADSHASALELAQSFARAQMKTLFIDADIARVPGEDCEPGWRELLSGARVEPPGAGEDSGLWQVGQGSLAHVEDRTVSARMVRAAIEKVARSFDVVIISMGDMQDSLSARFILSNADVGVLVLDPEDARASVLELADTMDTLPRNGSVAALRNALPGDPWLAVRT